MSDSPEPSWPGSRELEAMVQRAVAERVDPVRAQLATMGRALAVLAVRSTRLPEVGEVVTSMNALAGRLDELAPVPASVAGLDRRLEEGMAEVARLATLEQAVQDGLREMGARLAGTASAVLSAARAEVAERLDEVAGRLERSVAPLAGLPDRLDEVPAAVAGSVEAALARSGDSRGAQADELRRALSTAVQHALAQTDAARAADAARLLEQITAVAEALSAEDEVRRGQAEDLRRAVAGQLEQAVAGIEAVRAADAAEVRQRVAGLAAQVEDEARRRDEQAKALLAALDQRLESLHAAGVGDGEARDGRLAARLEALTAEQGRALLTRIDERTAGLAGLDEAPQRIAAEVRGAASSAFTGQVEPLVARLVEAIDTLGHEGGRIEAMARGHAGEARGVEERVAAMFAEVAERAETAVDRSRARISEGQVALGGRVDAATAELSRTVGGAADRLEARLVGAVDGLRAAGGHQNGALLDAVNRASQQLAEGLADVRSTLVATGTEQVAGGEAQLAAVEEVGRRVDAVGPVVARALLPEVERAARAASAAEDAVAGLRPDLLREALGEAAERAAGEVQAAARRLDESIAALADQVGQGLASLTDAEVGIRRELRDHARPAGEEAVARLDDLRASQGALREALEDGAHKAELAALDIRGLRERITPHLVALAEATTRRVEADQAGFDAVLARLDQLLAARGSS